MGAYILVLALQKGLFLLSVLYVLPISISHVRSSPIGLLARKFWHLTGTRGMILDLPPPHLTIFSSCCLSGMLWTWSVQIALSHWERNLGRGWKKRFTSWHSKTNTSCETLRVAVDLSSWTELSSSALGEGTRVSLKIISGTNPNPHPSITTCSLIISRPFYGLTALKYFYATHLTLFPPCLYCCCVKSSIFWGICLSQRGFLVHTAECRQESRDV